MKAIISVLLCLVFFIPSRSQELESTIRGIQNGEQAVDFIKTHPELHGEILNFKSFVDSSDIARKLFEAGRGNILKKEGFIYKLLWDTTATYSKVSYIYLSGEVLSKKQIDSLRRDIIRQYKNGTAFEQLASIYTMDQNPTGELDWFFHGNMAPEFVNAINHHAKNNIFTVDVSSQKWYYVVKKTHDSKQGREIVVLKLQNQ